MLLSHSEAETFNLCQRRHYYAFGEKLQKKSMSISLIRGNVGHSMMEAFFKALQLGQPKREALVALKNVAMIESSKYVKDPKLTQELLKLIERCTGFIESYWPRISKWHIIAVEQEFRLSLGEDVTYPFKVDLIFEESGQQKIVDWKFTYDFYTPDVVKLLPQIPKYIGALKALGFSVSDGYYGFIRYRSIKEPEPSQLFDLYPVSPPKIRIMEAFRDYVETIEDVARVTAQPLELRKAKARRIANNMICKSCGFVYLCQAEHNGSDGRIIREEEFEPSTYGYKEDVEIG